MSRRICYVSVYNTCRRNASSLGDFPEKKPARPAENHRRSGRLSLVGILSCSRSRTESEAGSGSRSIRCFQKCCRSIPYFYPFSDMPERICSIDFTGIGTAAQRGFSLLPGVPDCRSSWCAALLTEYAGREKGLREYFQVRSRRSQFSRKSLAAVRLPMGISTEAAQFLQVTRIISCRMSTTYSPSPSGQWQ